MAAVNENTMFLDRDGRRMPVFIAEPDSPGRHGAVIVIHEIFGLDEHIKDVARRFAQVGLCAYAPDLFAEVPGVPADRTNLDAMRTTWQSVPDAQFISDLQEVFELAKLSNHVHAEKIGVIGYCMGGAMALMFASETPEVAWVADYYGRVYYPQLSDTKTKHPIDYVSELKAPLLGLFAGEDALITEEHVNELRKRTADRNNAGEVRIYPEAKHAFFNDRREFYNEGVAKDAWKRTLDFIANVTKEPIAH